jgi:hypothetical protein
MRRNWKQKQRKRIIVVWWKNSNTAKKERIHCCLVRKLNTTSAKVWEPDVDKETKTAAAAESQSGGPGYNLVNPMKVPGTRKQRVMTVSVLVLDGSEREILRPE